MERYAYADNVEDQENEKLSDAENFSKSGFTSINY